MKVGKKTQKSTKKLGAKAKQILANETIDDNSASTPLPIEQGESYFISPLKTEERETEETLEGFYIVGNLSEFDLDDEEHKLFPIELQETRARRTIINLKSELFCILNVCPHQGAPLHKGIVDIEELNLSCMLHGWRFDLKTGECSSNRFVLDIFKVKIKDGVVWVSSSPTNKHIKGTRRDFMGNELIYNPGMGWI
jgi:nitrite reductase/ring-hydroxylating ferredoxin subunit